MLKTFVPSSWFRSGVVALEINSNGLTLALRSARDEDDASADLCPPPRWASLDKLSALAEACL